MKGILDITKITLGLCDRCKNLDREQLIQDLKRGKMFSDACKANVPILLAGVKVFCNRFKPKK